MCTCSTGFSFVENPFRERIGQVFTRTSLEPGQLSNNDFSGMCFEDFLEMMSVFSEHAPRDLKVFYAFRIYDFDEDGLVGLSDLERTCRQLVRGGLTDDEVATVCQKVLEESDIDGDGALSYLEFDHVVTRAADFLSTFHIRI
ncbi:calcium and integrin-binding family member 3-like [Phymastichus coffea]|uniref:calcium and integrin-binding family member 3-like n=1 Tax=Phymastichus coffea TaxID=108790 RepID=UPI00273A9728|nr:calcium and integrin-binding family member 3-like [Phymastichus coffea]